MNLGIQDRTAVVAAASRGLGRASAEALAAEGCRLAICSRDADAAAKTAAEIRQRYGATVRSAGVDVTDEAAVKTFIAETRRELGPVEICVANCGGPPPGHFADFEVADWKRAFETSFLSTLYLIRETLPDMQAAGWGRVVSITSASVRQPIDGLILSNAIRGAVVGLMKSLSLEYGPANILFNNVGPGMTATDRLLSNAEKRAAEAGVSRDEMIEKMSEAAALRRVGKPDEFGAVVAFLCSDRASYVTGESVMVDGGWVKGI